MIGEKLSIQSINYNVEVHVKTSGLYHRYISDDGKKPLIFVKEYDREYYNVEEYDFVSFYPTVYRYILSAAVPENSLQWRSYQSIFNASETNPEKKKILNIIYGLFQCEYSIFHSPSLGLLTRTIGAKIMNAVFEKFRESVVYAYVDSIFFSSSGSVDSEKIHDEIRERFSVPGLEMTLRKRFDRIIFYSKTSYTGKITGTGELVEKGIGGEKKHRDAITARRRLQRRALKKRLNNNNNNNNNNNSKTYNNINNNKNKNKLKTRNALIDMYKHLKR